MENFVVRHVRGSALKEYPLHLSQHAYQIGKSTETALHSVVTCIENAIEHKDLALGALLDIEGAFDRTSYDTIEQAAERHGIEPTVCRWICAMLKSRNIVSTLAGDTVRVSLARDARREVYFHLCCGAWSLTISSGNLIRRAIIQ
jgi:hypothetical protein